MALHNAMARVADAIVDTLPRQRFTVLPGTVASIDAGAAADGSDVVTVAIGADEIAAPRLDGWTPAAGDAVSVLLVDGSPLILGRVTGAPDIT